jgi:hypothetical protein
MDPAFSAVMILGGVFSRFPLLGLTGEIDQQDLAGDQGVNDSASRSGGSSEYQGKVHDWKSGTSNMARQQAALLQVCNTKPCFKVSFPPSWWIHSWSTCGTVVQ